MVFGCSLNESQESAGTTLFELIPASKTNIKFQNELSPTEELNTYTYRNFYNGGGVAIGDINNDGLQDIFFTGNQVANRLYLNKGNFTFEDITDRAGLGSPAVWSTGVSMADVNGDGLIDIYVCKSGPPGGENRTNDLFINNGDSTFTEKADEYGLAVKGLSVHASFFDYDLDGDLDMYLVSNPIRSFNNADMVEGNQRRIPDSEGGSRLFRNNLISVDGESQNESIPGFTDVTNEAGIYSSKIGFGLGVNVGDLNRDGWPDLYISNDFFERDYLYLNNKDGTFDEVLEKSMGSISLSSMGGDISDINNDGYPEIFISDMRGATEKRLKMNTKYSTWQEYRERVRKGYHHQFERNSLQLNRGPITIDKQEQKSENFKNGGPLPVFFSEISRMAGVDATDWSWGALIADFDLDGHRDIFVPNGIYKDLLNQDYLSKMSDPRAVRSVLKEPEGILKLVEMIPSTPVPNAMFAGEEGIRFQNKAEEWGVGTPSYSNGSAYGDLDNDGDLDLVVNNVNMDLFVYRNSAANGGSTGNNWLQIVLEGQAPNTLAVGAQVTAWSGGKRWYSEQQLIRGFQSTVSPVINLGLGEIRQLDSVKVRWPDGSISKQVSVRVNQRISFGYTEASEDISKKLIGSNINLQRENKTSQSFPMLSEVSPQSLGIDWQHKENTYTDFNRQPLLFHKRSTEGPPICSGDANGDGLTDLFLGGARDQPGALYLQQLSGKFKKSDQPVFESDHISEDTACTWLDIDSDGNLDLYVGSGGSEFPASSSALQDRLYLNNGEGKMRRSQTSLVPPDQGFRPTGSVAAADYDGDGDVDIFVGDRLRPFAYGIPVDGQLLENDGSGRFQQVDIPGLKEIGMTTDARWFDYDADGDRDLWVVGEWMPISVFENQGGELSDVTNDVGLDSTFGLWQSLTVTDLNGDGKKDVIAGNLGLNSVLQASRTQPLELWTGDFDQNGRIEQLLVTNMDDKSYPLALRDDLLNQVPGLKSAYPDYDSYAGETIDDIFSPDQLKKAVHLKAYQMASVVAWNQGNGQFRVEPLPDMAQLSPIYGLSSLDLNSDGLPDLLAGGNLYGVKPQAGRYDASYGLLIPGSDRGKLRDISASLSGFFVKGEVRGINTIKINNKQYIFVTRNDDTLAIFELKNEK